jgi:hypothetical protein
MNYRIAQGAFDRWYIFNNATFNLAWSGSKWVPTFNGVPTGAAQVCNFETKEEAEEYVREQRLD